MEADDWPKVQLTPPICVSNFTPIYHWVINTTIQPKQHIQTKIPKTTRMLLILSHFLCDIFSNTSSSYHFRWPIYFPLELSIIIIFMYRMWCSFLSSTSFPCLLIFLLTWKGVYLRTLWGNFPSRANLVHSVDSTHRERQHFELDNRSCMRIEI